MDTHAMVATSIQSLLKPGGKRFFFLTLDAAAGRALEADAKDNRDKRRSRNRLG
jgi:branched-chain amino acid transport system substrate-binding protein